MSFVLGINPEGKERVKGEASRIQSSQISSALVCVRRNVQHLEIKLLESTRFVLNNVLLMFECVLCVCVAIPFTLDVRIVAVPAGATQAEGHTGFLHIPFAVLALIFLARRIQPFLSLINRQVEFCVLTN